MKTFFFLILQPHLDIDSKNIVIFCFVKLWISMWCVLLRSLHICIIFLLDIISIIPYVMFPFVSVIIVWIMVQDTFRHDKHRNRHFRENVVKLTLPCRRLTDPHSENLNMSCFVKVYSHTYHENDWHIRYIFITSFYTYLSFILSQFDP